MLIKLVILVVLEVCMVAVPFLTEVLDAVSVLSKFYFVIQLGQLLEQL